MALDRYLSVWIDHFRRRSAALVELLEEAQVWTHPFVIGELACGNLAQRSKVLASLSELPRVPVVTMKRHSLSSRPVD